LKIEKIENFIGHSMKNFWIVKWKIFINSGTLLMYWEFLRIKFYSKVIFLLKKSRSWKS